MGRRIKSERLERAMPIVMPSTLNFCKLNLHKLSNGDAIQLLSDIVMDRHKQLSNR